MNEEFLCLFIYLIMLVVRYADPSGRAVSGESLRPIACWDCCSNPIGGMYVCVVCVVQ